MYYNVIYCTYYYICARGVPSWFSLSADSCLKLMFTVMCWFLGLIIWFFWRCLHILVVNDAWRLCVYSRRRSQSCQFTQELAALTWNFSHMLTCDMRIFHVFFFSEPPPWAHVVFFPFDSHILSVLPENWDVPGDCFQRGALSWCLPRPHEEKCLNTPVPALHTAHEFISFSIAAQ